MNIRTIEEIYKALDIPLEGIAEKQVITNGENSDDDGEILDEAVEEDFPNGFH